MTVENMKVKGTWEDVKNSARNTVSKPPKEGEPSSEWKHKILLAEHSPIRQLCFDWVWKDLPYWVSVHFVRHKYGVEHFVSTQRSDRTGVNRNEKNQDAPVSHECMANAQALISMSRKRLCGQAAKETRDAWIAVRNEILKIDPDVAHAMVPECVYRGFCPEFKSCGYVETEAYKDALEAYRRGAVRHE